eukprot:TRINITY_DN9444_c0_g1_i1.p1 TRINITY_DN9444_c0_g1~~TRINITY_DN9444_c0_g1_i1.p1  ORF type:complete len:411 (+),score=133.36 TRINITY_DN9444_c0_g1_i1:1-1233(+)
MSSSNVWNTGNVTNLDQNKPENVPEGEWVFYTTFWGIQQFFLYPNEVFEKEEKWRAMMESFNAILNVFAQNTGSTSNGSVKKKSDLKSNKSKHNSKNDTKTIEIDNDSSYSKSSDLNKNKQREDDEEKPTTNDAMDVDGRELNNQTEVKIQKREEIIGVKYLTSFELLKWQIKDKGFRRCILLQFLVMFQTLRVISEEGGGLGEAKKKQVAEVTKRTKELLRETSLHESEGEKFVGIVWNILKRENNWISWKIKKCVPFEKEKDNTLTSAGTSNTGREKTKKEVRSVEAEWKNVRGIFEDVNFEKLLKLKGAEARDRQATVDVNQEFNEAVDVRKWDGMRGMLRGKWDGYVPFVMDLPAKRKRTEAAAVASSAGGNSGSGNSGGVKEKSDDVDAGEVHERKKRRVNNEER